MRTGKRGSTKRAAYWLVDPAIAHLLSLPMVEWDGFISRMLTTQPRLRVLEVMNEMDALAEKTIRLRGYLEMREGGGSDRGHTEAVSESNRLTTLARKALGYTYPRQDVTF